MPDPSVIYLRQYRSRYAWPRQPFSSQEGPRGRVNAATIFASGSSASSYSTTLGVAALAGDLVIVMGVSNGTHVANGMQVSIGGFSFRTILEVQDTNSSSRWGQLFAFVTPIDLPSTTVIVFQPYGTSAASAFAVDIFRGWTDAQAGTAVSDNANLTTVVGSPKLATRPARGSLVIAGFSAASGASTFFRSPFTTASNTTSNQDAGIGYLIANGDDPYPATVDQAAPNSWGIIVTAFVPGVGAIWTPMATGPGRFRSRYALAYSNRYAWRTDLAAAIVAGGPQTFFVTLAVAEADVPVLLKQVNKELDVVTVTVPALLKLVGKVLAIAESDVPALIASKVKVVVLTVISLTVPALTKQIGKVLSITSVDVPALLKQVGKVLSVTTVSVPVLLKQVGKLLQVAEADVPALLKQVGKVLSVTESDVVTVATTKVKIMVLSVTTVTIPAMVRQVGKVLAVTTTTTPKIQRAIAKTVSVVSTSVPSLTRLIGKVLYSIQNLVPNPSFETDLATWGHYSTSGNTTDSRDNSQSVDGTWSLHENAGVAVDSGEIFRTPVLAAQDYLFSVWVKTGAGVTNACAVIRDNVSFVVQAGGHVTSANQPWQRFSGTFTANGTSTYDIVLGLGSYGATSSGDVWFDAVLLEAVQSNTIASLTRQVGKLLKVASSSVPAVIAQFGVIRAAAFVAVRDFALFLVTLLDKLAFAVGIADTLFRSAGVAGAPVVNCAVTDFAVYRVTVGDHTP